MRSFAEWDSHPQGQAVAGLPALIIERIGDAPPHRCRRRGSGRCRACACST
jgi:hypothetical protein